MNPENNPAPQPPDLNPQPNPPAEPVYPPDTHDTSVTPAAAGNPGETAAIIGMVLWFFGLALIGLFFSISGRKKSKAANRSTVLATIGIWLNVIQIVLAVLVVGALVAVTYVGVQQKAEETKNRVDSQQQQYHVDNQTVAP